jgi:glycosyltransferase involved in cell wall biosynthesis
MEQEKMVSVIIPTCNRKLFYISKAISSVMHQTYSNYEIIVVDDNIYNSKYSLNIKKYCKLHKITYLRTKGGEGANCARNIGAYHAEGFYLAFLDDDDMWLPNKLEVQLKYFGNDIGMVYSNGYVISSNSKRLYTKSENFISKGNLYQLLLYNYIGPTVTAVIRRDCFFDIGMFDEDMPAKQDYDLWIRIIEKFKIIGINQPLYFYLQHDSYQMSKNYSLILKGYKKIYIKNRRYYKSDSILTFYIYLKIAILFKYQKKYLKFIKYVFRALLSIRSKSLNILY